MTQPNNRIIIDGVTYTPVRDDVIKLITTTPAIPRFDRGTVVRVYDHAPKHIDDVVPFTLGIILGVHSSTKEISYRIAIRNPNNPEQWVTTNQFYPEARIGKSIPEDTASE